MDFNFSDDQEQLRDAVRKWVDKGYDFERRRGIEANGGFSREAWDDLAELGLGGLYIAEEDGGLGMGPVAGMVVMEELGRGIVLARTSRTTGCRALRAARPSWCWPTRSARRATGSTAARPRP
jgi:alkylation response protein AidB-like acyl-CoA dehydrogenase